MYYRIKKYCDIFPDFPLYFTFAKNKREFNFVYPTMWEDLFQVIALCMLEYQTVKSRNNAISREVYHLARHVGNLPQIKQIGYKKYNTKCKKLNKCDNCRIAKYEYMRGNILPGKKVCSNCRNKIIRKNRRIANMHVVDLIANAIKEYNDIEIPEQTEKGICCVTGIECQTIRRKDLFSANFTNTDILKAPDSDRAGISAAIALKYRPERSSWFVNDKEFIRFDKNLFRDMFLNGVKNSKYWSIYITTSYKKHGAFYAKVNNCTNGNKRKYGIWRFEQLNVDARDGRKNKNWYKIIFNALSELGIGRSIIESLNCPSWLIKKIGLNNWISFYKWAKDKYQSPLYKLCCYLLPSQKELKENEN